MQRYLSPGIMQANDSRQRKVSYLYLLCIYFYLFSCHPISSIRIQKIIIKPNYLRPSFPLSLLSLLRVVTQILYFIYLIAEGFTASFFADRRQLKHHQPHLRRGCRDETKTKATWTKHVACIGSFSAPEIIVSACSHINSSLQCSPWSQDRLQ